MKRNGALTSFLVGAGAGAPAGVVLVWLLETYTLSAPIPGAVASAIGTMAASIATLLWHVVTVLTARALGEDEAQTPGPYNKE